MPSGAAYPGAFDTARVNHPFPWLIDTTHPVCRDYPRRLVVIWHNIKHHRPVMADATGYEYGSAVYAASTFRQALATLPATETPAGNRLRVQRERLRG